MALGNSRLNVLDGLKPNHVLTAANLGLVKTWTDGTKLSLKGLDMFLGLKACSGCHYYVVSAFEDDRPKTFFFKWQQNVKMKVDNENYTKVFSFTS